MLITYRHRPLTSLQRRAAERRISHQVSNNEFNIYFLYRVEPVAADRYSAILYACSSISNTWKHFWSKPRLCWIIITTPPVLTQHNYRSKVEFKLHVPPPPQTCVIGDLTIIQVKKSRSKLIFSFNSFTKTPLLYIHGPSLIHQPAKLDQKSTLLM